jgi:hypothetical protein
MELGEVVVAWEGGGEILVGEELLLVSPRTYWLSVSKWNFAHVIVTRRYRIYLLDKSSYTMLGKMIYKAQFHLDYTGKLSIVVL